jgi:2'-5' RNA ligase
VIPVPAARQATAGWPGEAGRLTAPGMPHHVTVLYPFMAADAIDGEVERALEEIAARAASFGFELSEVGRFPDVLFIAPRPAEPFVALTEAVHARWPQHPPYRGEFADIVPHVTIASGPEPAGLAGATEAALPVQSAALELWLLTPQASGAWATRNRFALGPVASVADRASRG